MFFAQKNCSPKADFDKNYKIDKNAINGSYMKISAKLDHFRQFYAILVNFGPFSNIMAPMGQNRKTA